MTTYKYSDRATRALSEFCSDNFATYLTATETELGLEAGDLEEPVAYLTSIIPSDPRNPVFFVDCSGCSVEDWDQGIHVYEFLVILLFSGDADVYTGQEKAKHYLSAMIDMLRSDATLNSGVEYCWCDDVVFDAEKEGDRTRHAVAIRVYTRIHEP